jgi:predicted component of type VI protein secretion system
MTRREYSAINPWTSAAVCGVGLPEARIKSVEYDLSNLLNVRINKTYPSHVADDPVTGLYTLCGQDTRRLERALRAALRELESRHQP